MSGPQDLTLEMGPGPKALSSLLADLATYFRGELQATGGDVVVPRIIVKLFELALAEASARCDALEETARACEAIERRAVTLARDVERLEAVLARRPSAEVVSLHTIADRLRPVPRPTGGGAA